MPQQTMASMVYQNKEVLFPINDQFVKSIDQAAKKILVELPDGLLAIYLS
jgi:16S rRNA processing protein RimM